MVQTESDCLMQLMPASAEQYSVPDPLDPAKNLDGESRYFKDLLTRFNGNTVLALAAYNADATAVITHEGILSFSETEQFAERILALYQTYKIQ